MSKVILEVVTNCFHRVQQNGSKGRWIKEMPSSANKIQDRGAV